VPAPDTTKDQQSRLQALALKPKAASVRVSTPARSAAGEEDGMSLDKIQARVNQPSSTLENILHRQEPVARWGINE
jgi:hypothetical protein